MFLCVHKMLHDLNTYCKNEKIEIGLQEPMKEREELMQTTRKYDWQRDSEIVREHEWERLIEWESEKLRNRQTDRQTHRHIESMR